MKETKEELRKALEESKAEVKHLKGIIGSLREELLKVAQR